jgi:hypothetical protein
MACHERAGVYTRESNGGAGGTILIAKLLNKTKHFQFKNYLVPPELPPAPLAVAVVTSPRPLHFSTSAFNRGMACPPCLLPLRKSLLRKPSRVRAKMKQYRLLVRVDPLFKGITWWSDVEFGLALKSMTRCWL